jgi:hypothetical protein
MMRTALLLLLLWPACAWPAPPTLKIPPEIKPAGQYAMLAPDTDAVAVTYVGLDRVDPIPSAVLKDGRLFLLDTRGLAKGRYRFAAVGAGKDGEQARTDFVVVVGDAPPGPTPPDPTPGPIDDPLTKALQTAYAAEADPKKDEHRKALAGLYRAGAEFANREDVTTWGRLLSAMREAATATGLDGKVPLLRVAVRDHGLSGLPSEAQRPLDAAGRKLAAETFTKVAVALEGVK